MMLLVWLCISVLLCARSVYGDDSAILLTQLDSIRTDLYNIASLTNEEEKVRALRNLGVSQVRK